MEGMRMSPALGTRLHRVAPDRELVYNQWRIPASTPVGMTTLLMHMDASVFPEPKTFDPERWINPETRKRAEKAYAPFSRGTRDCIGMHLAWAELYLVISTLVQRFDFDFAVIPSVILILVATSSSQLSKDRACSVAWFLIQRHDGRGSPGLDVPHEYHTLRYRGIQEAARLRGLRIGLASETLLVREALGYLAEAIGDGRCLEASFMTDKKMTQAQATMLLVYFSSEPGLRNVAQYADMEQVHKGVPQPTTFGKYLEREKSAVSATYPPQEQVIR
ncbi:hypothetical protein JX265_011712 [Neoarthrinium moseri]|uniref:Uncharacterized protein n=1 Tax=Neoarthrinium moseri TaxID=1658444 RepID=A0A9P9WBY9_9PEZI|nr:hypothetical protein JX265_011712 [Neoarthrinium moseri]